MSFLKKLSLLLATKVGTVQTGKYAGCKMSLGSDTDAKVQVGGGWNQFVFIKGTKEMGRVNVSDVSSCATIRETVAFAILKFTYKSGETSNISVAKVDSQGKPLRTDYVTSIITSIN